MGVKRCGLPIFLDLVFRRNRCNFRRGKFRSALLAEITKRQQREAMAGLANVMIDLEAALKLAAIELSERAPKRPCIARRLQGSMPVRMLLGPGRPRTTNPKST